MFIGTDVSSNFEQLILSVYFQTFFSKCFALIWVPIGTNSDPRLPEEDPRTHTLVPIGTIIFHKFCSHWFSIGTIASVRFRVSRHCEKSFVR